MKCPKCGLEQTQSEECTGCGIIVKKYLERKNTPLGKPTKATKLRAGRKTRYGRLQIEREQRDFYQSQFISLNAGLTPVKAVENFIAEPGDLKDLVPYRRISEVLDNGDPASEGMRLSPDYFPDHHARLIEAGESSGDPENMFKHLGNMVNQRIKTSEAIAAALRKPRNTLLGSIFILPLPTMISGGLIAYLTQSLLPLVVVLLLFFIGSRLFKNAMNSPSFALTVDEKLFNFSLYRKYQLNNFARVFKNLYAAGVTSADAWGIAGSVSDNSFLNQVFSSHKSLIEDGKSVADTARQTNAFDSNLLQVFVTGESAGSLDTALERYLVASEEEFSTLLGSATSRLTIGIGLLVTLYVGYRIIFGFTALLPEMPVIQLSLNYLG
jgi:type II secretory pathway component PulF